MNPLSRRSFLSLTAAGGVSFGSVLPAGTRRNWEPEVLDTPVALHDLHTPALIVDMDQMDQNLAKMANVLAEHSVGLRPHAKTHKCPHIARKQIELGAVGICCAKVSEAECMADADITHILITSPVTTKEKIDRVIALAKRCDGLQIVIDHEANARDFDEAVGAAGIQLGVIIDLDPGMGRTGVAMGEPAVALAKTISSLKNLELGGVQCYAGNLMHVGGYEQRRARSVETLQRAAETKRSVEAAGIELPVFTGGGTGTYDIDSAVDGVTDLQCGSYLFMDVQYGIVGAPEGELFDAFPASLFVLSAAISQPVPGRITIDAGLKALYNDSPRPRLRDLDQTTYGYGGDEHGIVRFDGGGQPLKLGDKTAIIPAHCDPTINLYDAYYAYRGDEVVEVWPITARGMAQ